MLFVGVLVGGFRLLLAAVRHARAMSTVTVMRTVTTRRKHFFARRSDFF